MTLPINRPILTLLTDFGTKDHYTGVMKGVILGICPEAQIVDISHDVEPFQIAQGTYLLAQAWPWFPQGSIHVAVVDPGVGSARKALAVEAEGNRFVLPDNGLLSLLGVRDPVVREITNSAFTLPKVSRTFQGRDVFAPCAAHLARGCPFEEIGPLVTGWERLPQADNVILHIDRFGNIITSLKPPFLGPLRIRDHLVKRFVTNYAEAKPNELFLIEGSGGYLEISMREGSAAARIGCKTGEAVKWEPAGRTSTGYLPG